MKKLNFSLLLISLFLVGNTFKLWTQIPGIQGDGSATKPYLINSANLQPGLSTPLSKLNKIADWVNRTGSWNGSWVSNNKHFKLCADISGFTNTIGTETYPFYGIFDGNNHMITVNIYKPLLSMVGLFGRADYATITRLTVAGSVRGAVNVAGVVGWGKNTTITFCTNVARKIISNY